MRLILIACEIFYREVSAVVARSINRVDVKFMPKGLHDIGQEKMQQELLKAIDEIDETQYDAVLLGYGLCNNGLVDLATRTIPLVVPRAHDCMTLFLGSKERYLEYFHENPGVYFKTTGWVERGDGVQQFVEDAIQSESGLGQTYEQLVEKYGEDNAKFLYEQLSDMTRNYRQITYIEMGLEPDDRFEKTSRELARERGWDFDKISGDLCLFRELVDGPWAEERFLVLQPGERIAPSFDDLIIRAEPPA
ncbi:MAG: DUF1638 domain-containing protein [Pirellulales bacterium]|nr:DUF1638 domain-containing protein [Pirellulales bacterium]